MCKRSHLQSVKARAPTVEIPILQAGLQTDIGLVGRGRDQGKVLQVKALQQTMAFVSRGSRREIMAAFNQDACGCRRVDLFGHGTPLLFKSKRSAVPLDVSL